MVTYLYILHCMDFSVNSQWWGEGEMMRPSVQGVDPPVCCTPGCYCYICKRQLCGFPQCAASWMTYARDSFVDSQGGLLSSRGGAQTHWHRHIGTSLTIPYQCWNSQHSGILVRDQNQNVKVWTSHLLYINNQNMHSFGLHHSKREKEKKRQKSSLSWMPQCVEDQSTALENCWCNATTFYRYVHMATIQGRYHI